MGASLGKSSPFFYSAEEKKMSKKTSQQLFLSAISEGDNADYIFSTSGDVPGPRALAESLSAPPLPFQRGSYSIFPPWPNVRGPLLQNRKKGIPFLLFVRQRAPFFPRRQ